MECGGLTAATTMTTTTTTTLDDLFSSQSTEVDVGMEWLSIFVEDCLSSKGSCLPPPKSSAGPTTTTTTSDPARPPRLRKPQNAPLSFHSSAVAGKARSKRKRIAAANSRTPLTNPWSQSLLHFPGSDPPLLDQAYWLADSELIAPKKAAEEEEEEEERSGGKVRYTASEQGREDEEEDKGRGGSMGIPQPRRCTHCLSQRTPQWRAGPLGPKTLCNACGVRYKSGRLLPEYRPAKSPTFVSYLHSNSHKKVMEMRNGIGMGAESSIIADEEKGC